MIPTHTVTDSHQRARHLLAKMVDHEKYISRMIKPRSWLKSEHANQGPSSISVSEGLRSLPSLSSFRTPDNPWWATSAIQIPAIAWPRASSASYKSSQSASYSSYMRLIQIPMVVLKEKYLGEGIGVSSNNSNCSGLATKIIPWSVLLHVKPQHVFLAI